MVSIGLIQLIVLLVTIIGKMLYFQISKTVHMSWVVQLTMVYFIHQIMDYHGTNPILQLEHSII